MLSDVACHDWEPGEALIAALVALLVVDAAAVQWFVLTTLLPALVGG